MSGISKVNGARTRWFARCVHPVFAGMLAVARNLRHIHSMDAEGAAAPRLFAIGAARNDFDALHNEMKLLDC